MIVSWNDVENELKRSNSSINETNSIKQLFYSQRFQNYVLKENGLITEPIYEEGKYTILSKNKDMDLSKVSNLELDDYLRAGRLTVSEANTITPNQMSSISNKSLSLVEEVLHSQLPATDNIRFSFSAIVQTGFPFRKLKGKQHFERKNGDLTVTMTAPNEIGLPYGMFARVLFVYICSQIVKNKSNRISLGNSLKKFVVDDLERSWITGKAGSSNRWMETISSLFGTTFTATLVNKDEKATGVHLKNVSIANEARLWWNSKDGELEEGYVEISESFATAVREHASPLDIEALHKLSALKSPLAFDLYSWLTLRYYKMEQSGVRIVRIAWKQLFEQTGTNIQTVSRFAIACKEALIHVKTVYPEANFNSDNKSYLILIASPPHVKAERKLNKLI